MVSILPPKMTPWQIIGKAMSQFGQNAPELLEKRYERNQIQGGLDKVGKNNPELQKILDVMKPFVGTRQGAQYTESLLPEVLKLMQSQQQTAPQTEEALGDVQDIVNKYQKQPLPNFGQNGNQPLENKISPQNIEAIQPEFNDIFGSIKKGMGEQYFPSPRKAPNVPYEESRKPQPPLKPPKPITLQDEAKMRQILKKNGVNRKELQDDYINKAKQYQKDTYEAEKEGFQNVEDYQKARIAEDNRFWNEVAPLVKDTFPGMGPEEENIWKGIARTNENIGTDEARLRDTNQRYNQFVEQPLAAFSDTGPALPYFSALNPEAVNDAVESSRSQIQDHLNSIENIPESEAFPKELKGEISNYLRKKYRTEMVSKDFGVSQAAYAVSNLGEKAKRSIASLPRYNPELSEQLFESVDVTPTDKKNKYIERLSNSLLNLGPEDSILLARDAAIQNNYPDEFFNRALNLALKNGLQLSSFQRSERPELDIPQKMDLNSILRGKRSMFDLFKGKK